MKDAPRLRFDEHDGIVLGDVQLRFVRSTPSGHVFQRMDAADVEVAVTDEQLAEAARRYDYLYLPRHYASGRAEVRVRSGCERFAEIPRNEHERILRRHGWARDFRDLLVAQAECPPEDPKDRASRSYVGAEVGIRLILAKRKLAREEENRKFIEGAPRKPSVGSDGEADEVPPCAKTLLAWLRILLMAPDWDLSAFRDGKRNSGPCASVHPEVEGVLARHAISFAAENRPTKKAVHLSARAEVATLNASRPPGQALTLPGYKTMSARIDRLDASFVFAARKGADAALKKFKTVTSGLQASRVGQVVIMDEWRVPIQLLVSAGLWEVMSAKERKRFEKRMRRLRPWVCVAIDVASRTVLGMAIAMTSTTETVLEVLRMIISDKGLISDGAGSLSPWDQHVNPDIILTDGGSNFISAEVQAALAGLGIRHATSPAARPMVRGHVERFFGTVHTAFISRFTGRTFENTVVKGDYKPQERASINEDEFCRLICRYISDQYHNTPHSGLDDETPANAYRRLIAECRGRPLPDCNAVAAVFGIELERRVNGRGVRVLGLHFQSRELQAHWRARGDGKVMVRVDPRNLGGVTVRLGEAWHWCRCVTPGLNGVSMHVWEQASTAIRKRHATEAALTEHIVLAAVREFDAHSKQSIARVGLGDVRPDRHRLLRIEREVLLGWTMPGDEVPTPENADPWAAAIESTGPDTPSPPASLAGSGPEGNTPAVVPISDEATSPDAPASETPATASAAGTPGAGAADAADVGTAVSDVARKTVPTGRRPGPPPRSAARPHSDDGSRVVKRKD